MYKLLVVDDEFNIRDGIVNAVMWEKCNTYVVGEASNGIEALKKVEETLPDIVITDVSMDDMDGLEFAENLKMKYPDIKVIILTGYEEFEYAKRALKLRVFSYLLKPILPDELIKTVSEVIEEIKAEKLRRERVITLESEIRHISESLMNHTKYEENTVLDSLPDGHNVKSVINKAQKYIEGNYTNPDISLNSIADHVYLNPAYFSKLYKKETGKTYMEYITRLRIQKAKNLLTETNIRIADIGFHIGYTNSQYFTTLFKKITGMTPGEYREKAAYKTGMGK